MPGITKNVEAIEQEIRSLSPSEVAELRAWFEAYAEELWDRQIERDVEAGRLDALAEKALEAHRRGESHEL